jgi:aspartate 1-decarboxylase
VPVGVLPNEAVQLSQSQNAANLVTGILQDSRLSPNVVLRGNTNTFNAIQSLRDPVNAKSSPTYIQYLSFKDINNAEIGYVGYGSGSNNDFYYYNTEGGQRFYANSIEKMSINSTNVSVFTPLLATSVTASSIRSKYIETFVDNTKGFVTIYEGSTTNAGYIEFIRPDQQRSMYFGYSTNTGANLYQATNGSWHKFGGGKVEIASSIEVPVGVLPNEAVQLSQSQNAANLVTGILQDSRLSTNVPKLNNAVNDFLGAAIIQGNFTANGFTNRVSMGIVNSILGSDEIVLHDHSNTVNNDLLKGITTDKLSTAFSNLTKQSYQAVLIENGSYSIPNDAGYVVMSRSGTLTNTGIFTFNLPTTPNSNTQEIEFSLPFLHAMIGFNLQFKQGATLVKTITFGTSAQTGNNYAIYAPSNASFRIRYNSLTNAWFIVNIFNTN